MLHNKTLETFIKFVEKQAISNDRLKYLAPIVEYIKEKNSSGETPKMIFVCTHNSRRSQLSQYLAHIASRYYDVKFSSYSGGIETTAVKKVVIDLLKEIGIEIESLNPDFSNPHYRVKYSNDDNGLLLFSKKYDDVCNPLNGFSVVMTCSDADANCPFIPTADKRFPLHYNKMDAVVDIDGLKVDEQFVQIAIEMFYIFKSVKQQL